jgi:pilus assembly protein CpaE
MTDGRVLALHRQDFEALVTTRPHMMRSVLAAVSRRAARANQRLMTDQRADSAPTANGHVYSVFSPRGGAGKTTLAVNLAIRLAELMPERVGMLDLDLLFDDAALLLNLEPVRSLANILESELGHFDSGMLTEYTVEHPSTLRVVVGARRPEDGERVGAAHVRAALAAMKRQFLVTVVDCAGTFGEPTLAALEASARIVVVCTPELSTLRDVRYCQRIFGQALQLDKTRLVYAYNHVLPVSGLTRLQFESALEQPMAVEIPHAGHSAAKAALAEGTAVRPKAHSSFYEAIDQLARDLRPPEARSADGRWSAREIGTPRASAVLNGLLRLLRRNAH